VLLQGLLKSAIGQIDKRRKNIFGEFDVRKKGGGKL
jgi:hypothetical protein